MTDQTWVAFNDAWLNGETVNGYQLSPEAIGRLRAQLPGTPVFDRREGEALARRQLGIIEVLNDQLVVRLDEGVDPDSLSRLRPSLDIQAIVDSPQIEQADLRGVFTVEKEPDYNGGFSPMD